MKRKHKKEGRKEFKGREKKRKTKNTQTIGNEARGVKEERRSREGNENGKRQRKGREETDGDCEGEGGKGTRLATLVLY